MRRKHRLLSLLLLMAVLVACGGGNFEEIPPPTPTAIPADLVEDEDVAVEDDTEPFVDLTPQATSRFGEGAAQLVAEDEQSTGQEDRSRPTPFVPRDKHNDSGQNEQVDSTQNTQATQNNTGVIAVVETPIAADEDVDERATAPPRSEEAPTAIPVAATPIPNVPTASASNQPPATSPPPKPTQTPQTNLNAGAIDDNERFDAYLDYIANYDGDSIER